MTINPSAEAHNTYDVMGTTISEFYETVDASVLPSDVQPGRYRTTITPSYQSQCPINRGSFTTLDLGTVDPQVILLDRSFISLTAEGKLKCSKDLKCGVEGDNAVQHFLGAGRSIELTSRYQILHNGKVIVDQAYVGEESFIVSNCIKDGVKKRRPGEYTTYDSAHNDKEFKCGVRLNIAGSAADTVIPAGTGIPFQIQAKIHLDDIPFFRNWDIMPGWYGNWQIKLWCDPQNLKTCTINPAVSAPTNTGTDGDDYAHDWAQLGEEHKGITQYTGKKWTAEDMAFTCEEYKFTSVNYVATSEVMYPSDYEANRNKYRGKPLNLPYHHFDLARFSGRTNVISGGASYVLTGMVKCCECLYLLPFSRDCQHTVCRNPQYQSFYLTVGSFGPYPNNPIDTIELVNGQLSETFPNFLNMTLDAINLDNSPIVTASPEVLNSLFNDTKVYGAVTYTTDGAKIDTEYKTITNNTCKSNFFIGIPFADDNQFQGGLTTQSNINIKMNYANAQYDTETQLGPTAIFCCDYILMISPNEFGQATVSNVQDKLY